MASYYDVIGVAVTATADEIRHAYVERARKLHPDAGGSSRAMQELNEAWYVLRDPARRRAYDHDHDVPPSPFRRPAAPVVDRDEPIAADLPEDVVRPSRPSDLLVMAAPVTTAVAIGCFAVSMVMASPVLLAGSFVLLVLSGVAFFVTPFVVMSRQRRR